MTTYIYILRDPRDLAVRYVGKTVNLRIRKKAHSSGVLRFRVGAWLGKLRELTLKPIFEIVEMVEGSGWIERERHWIEHYKSHGYDLCNLSNGGEGEVGRRLSSETKERLRQMFKGRPIPQRQREQISRSLTGKKQSQETIEKRKATIAARRAAYGWVKKSSDSWPSRIKRKIGCPVRYSPEWKAKISDGLRRYFASRKAA
jgi:hypothetical protein